MMVKANSGSIKSSSGSSGHDNTYDKYAENDQFVYDENSSGKSFIKQDSELYNEEEAAIPGSSVRVKRVDSDWKIYVNGNEVLVLKSSRFTTKERDWLQSTDGFLFLINGAKNGWDSVSEFKRQLKDKPEVQ
jgi:hypothetical protein